MTRPEKGTPIMAAWALSVDAALKRADEHEPGLTVSPVGRSRQEISRPPMTKRVIRAPFETWICRGAYNTFHVRVALGNVLRSGTYVPVECGEGWEERGEVERPAEQEGGNPTYSDIWKFYDTVPPENGELKEVALEIEGDVATLVFSNVGASGGGTRVVIAEVTCPLTTGGAGSTTGFVRQRVVGDVIIGGGGGAVLGRVTDGGGGVDDGVYEVEILGNGPTGEPTGTATVIATEVAAGATLPVGSIVICHPIALQSFRAEEQATE